MIEEGIKECLEQLKKKGLTGDVYGIRSRVLSYSIMNGEVSDSNEYEDMGLGIRVFKDGRVGFGYCAPGKEEIGVKRAIELTSLSPKMEMELPMGEKPSEVRTYDKKVERAMDDGIEIAQQIIDGASSVDDDILPSRGTLKIASGTVIVGNTKGLFYSQDGSIITGGVAATLPGEKTSLMASESSSSRKYDIDFEEVGIAAGEKVVSMKDLAEIPGDKIPVILSPDAMGILIHFGLLPSFDGENVRKGKSVYEDRVGDEVAAGYIDLVEDPTSNWGLGSFPFDDEGVLSSPVSLISGGILDNFFYDLKEAVQSGTESTANGVRPSFKSPPQIGSRNVMMSGEDITRDELFADRAILVDNVMGAHTSSPASGDFSVVANPAWLVEDGVKKGRLEGLMISGNLPGSLHTMELGDDRKKIYDSIGSATINIELPSVKLKDVTISGK